MLEDLRKIYNGICTLENETKPQNTKMLISKAWLALYLISALDSTQLNSNLPDKIIKCVKEKPLTLRLSLIKICLVICDLFSYCTKTGACPLFGQFGV